MLTVSDLHCPWQHPGAFDFLADLKRKYKPDVVVVLGDEIDAMAFSKYPKDPDAPSASEEWQRALDSIKPLYKIFPRALVCEGNHTLRPWKRAQEAGIPKHFLFPIRDLLQAPHGWEWKPQHEVDGVLYLHGDGFSGQNAALNAARQHRWNVVIGHVHAYASVQYSTGIYDRVWGMNAGCLINPDAICFQYAKHLSNRATLGTGVVLEGTPHFVPLPNSYA